MNHFLIQRIAPQFFYSKAFFFIIIYGSSFLSVWGSYSPILNVENLLKFVTIVHEDSPEHSIAIYCLDIWEIRCSFVSQLQFDSFRVCDFT